MKLRLHANATTTPRIRAYIQSSQKSIASLARELYVSETTVRRWKHRNDVQDLSTKPPQPPRSMTPTQEELVVGLRMVFGLTLDELLEVTHAQINAEISRSGLHRCLNRHGVARLRDLKPLAFTHFKNLWRGDRSGQHLVIRAEVIKTSGRSDGADEEIFLATRFGTAGRIHVELKRQRPLEFGIERFLQELTKDLPSGQESVEVHLGPAAATLYSEADPVT